MPSVNVGLDVRNFPSSGSDGYTNTSASNNAMYSYKYSGGTDGNGNVSDIVEAGELDITVTVGTDPRYTITGVVISGDIESQLTWVSGTAPTNVVIKDSDSQTGSGYYSITVTDSTADCTLPCDPEITNKPKPPK